MSEVEQLASMFILVFVGVTLAPAIARRLRVPVIVAEIVYGILLGRSALNLVPEHPTVEFLSSFGLVYLMFLAGLHVDVRIVRDHFGQTVAIALASITLPFLAGMMLAASVGTEPLILGTIFSTTSLGLILPLRKELKESPQLISVLLGSVVVVDILSIFLLGFAIVFISGDLDAGFAYGVAALLTMFVLPYLASRPRVQAKLQKWLFRDTQFEHHVRFSFALIFMLGAVSGTLGFHSIVGAFIAGLIIAELTPETSQLEAKLESFGYGFFIPLFFIFVGAKVDLGTVFAGLGAFRTLLVLIGASILSKVVGVLLVSRITGLTWREGTAFGFFHAARLSLILAAADIASGLGIIDRALFSGLILLALVSALVGPTVGRWILKRYPALPSHTAFTPPADRPQS